MMLQQINVDTHRVEQAARDQLEAARIVNANFSSLQNETSYLNSRLTKMEATFAPFLRWLEEVHPEVIADYATWKAVTERIERPTAMEDVVMCESAA